MAMFKAAMKTGTRIMAMVIILILYKLAFNLANVRKKMILPKFFLQRNFILKTKSSMNKGRKKYVSNKTKNPRFTERL